MNMTTDTATEAPQFRKVTGPTETLSNYLNTPLVVQRRKLRTVGKERFATPAVVAHYRYEAKMDFLSKIKAEVESNKTKEQRDLDELERLADQKALHAELEAEFAKA